MKKLLTLAALAFAAFTAQATDYTDVLKVTVNGNALSDQETTVSIDANENQRYKLSLNNLVLQMNGQPMGIGNIVVDDVPGIVDGDVTTIRTSQSINITEGTLEGIPIWMGPNLGSVPIELTAEIRGSQLYFIINIDMTASIGQTIDVQFGDGGYQIKNSGFENFHTATASSATSDEPNNWHSFMSCTGMLAGIVSSVPHTFISDDVRPGTTGTKSVLIKSGLALGSIVANGTLTTGRLKAGGFSATSTDNNAFLDITSTEVDANGDPFYALINGKPDSLAVWVKFKQETPVEEHPYATITAVITDGSYYQEPVDKDYTDIIVGRAADTKIASNGFAWQKLVMPFDYSAYTEKDPKAILVTISTNADPGEGTGADSLLVDDFELIYNGTATGISVKGNAVENFAPATSDYTLSIKGIGEITAEDVAVTTNAQDAKVTVDVVHTDDGAGTSIANITVMSADLKKVSTYTVTVTDPDIADGIDNLTIDDNAIEGIYNLNGQRIETPVSGQVYITKYADGKTVKTIMK